MLNNEWDALVHLARVREPKLGTKLAALRALKKTRYNVQIGHPDASVRNEALTAIKVYKDILEACVQAVWGGRRWEYGSKRRQKPRPSPPRR